MTFFVRGERGSIDLLAWHPAPRILLVIEVKSVVPDIQSMLAALDRKVQLAPSIALERGWSPVAIGKQLVIGDTRTSRRRIEALSETFGVAFPARSAEVWRWIRRPSPTAPMRGLVFVSSGHVVTTRHRASRPRHCSAT